MCRLRSMLYWVAISLAIPATGCAVSPRSRLAACQSYNCDLQRKYQELCTRYQNLRIEHQQLANRDLDTDDRLAEQDELIANYQQRLRGGQPGRDQYALTGQGGSNALPENVRKQLREFASRHPEFVEVDAEGGISKFKSDVLFRTGEAVLLPESQAVLQEFASIFSGGNGRTLKIMIVGHTDRQPIKKESTRAQHTTNWHLSAHRAIAVEQYLESVGIDPSRMGVVGYGPYQPSDPTNLAKNRRVEIYVLAPDAPVVGRANNGQRN